VAGGIAGSPTLLFLGLIEREGVTLLLALMMAALPATIAGLIGAHFGSGILTSPRVVSRPRAALRGMCVGAGSLAFYLFLLADLGSSSSHESFPAILLMLELVGFILAGWLVCIVGAFAGFLFFHEYRAEKIKEAKRWQALSSC
jgi:ABC-type thiamin/hydroxymethylpyrimidine transport system permease subunit